MHDDTRSIIVGREVRGYKWKRNVTRVVMADLEVEQVTEHDRGFMAEIGPKWNVKDTKRHRGQFSKTGNCAKYAAMHPTRTDSTFVLRQSGGGGVLICCLPCHSTIDHASLSRRSIFLLL